MDVKDNAVILYMLRQRLALGLKRYGHGVQVHDDTRQYGTPTNDWQAMALEEMLDGLVYTTASIIKHQQRRYSPGRVHDDNIHNELTHGMMDEKWASRL